jgi:hypothetical protein
MSDDDLRHRMSASNPIRTSQPVDPVTSDRARELMEGIMSTSTIERRTEERPKRRIVTAIAAALVIVVGIGAFVATRGSQTDTAPLALTAEDGTTMASCIRFDVDILAGMTPAFAGTVTELTDSVATLDVDRWYTGGDATTVEIQYQPGFQSLIGTPNLEVGQRYLITAANGNVNGCGYSGPATADLEAAFDKAFGS